jgi:hypothetical protein
MPMTKEDWAEVEKRLSWTGAGVKLHCDGYRLSVCRERYKAMRDCLVVYVDGVWKGDWSRDCEERRRFACPRKTYVWNAKDRASIKARRAKMPKRDLKWLSEKFKDTHLFEPDKTFIYYSPIWPGFKALKAHLVRNNKEISIIKEVETQAT